jgi:hypothetical protein
MTYTKPELVLLAEARVAIQTTDPNDTGNGHKELSTIDSPKDASSGAYEADE